MVALTASTHRVLEQHHGVSKSVHPGVSNINITTSTPKGVTAAPFSNNVQNIGHMQITNYCTILLKI